MIDLAAYAYLVITATAWGTAVLFLILGVSILPGIYSLTNVMRRHRLAV
jgi:hypothetical protein